MNEAGPVLTTRDYVDEILGDAIKRIQQTAEYVGQDIDRLEAELSDARLRRTDLLVQIEQLKAELEVHKEKC